MTNITPELDKRLDKTLRSYECDSCEGRGVVGQSPTFPEGSSCDECDGTGFIKDGSTHSDLKKDIKATINLYVAENI